MPVSLSSDHLYRRLAWGGLAAAVVLIGLTFQDYGVTWDEFYHEANGRHVLAYYATWFADRAVLTYHNLYLYGGVFDGLTAALDLVSPFGHYETAHLLNALVGLLGVVGGWKLVNFLAGPRAATIAAALLLLTPAWYGHMFFNPKDIPFAAGMTWSLYGIIRLAAKWPATPWRLNLWLGIALGMTLGVRVGGIIALGYLAVGVATYLVGAVLPQRGLRGMVSEGARIALRSLIPSLAIAYVVMLLCWPWAQQSPLANPLMALRLFSHIAWDINVLFEGRLVNSLNLPAEYLLVYFAVKLPEVALLLLALGACLVPHAVMRNRTSRPFYEPRTPGLVILGAAAAVPFVYFAVQRPVTYDSIRHFLFVLPPLAALAGIAADRLLERAERLSWLAGATASAALGLALLGQAVTLARLHPDQYVYYNAFVGGVKGAENRFELDYWGNSYAEAVDMLVEQLRLEQEAGAPALRYKVAVCSSGVSASYFFPPDLAWTGSEHEADFYITTTRLDCDDSLDGDPFLKVEREGAVLSIVKDRRFLKAFDPERLQALGPPEERVHPGTIGALSLVR